MDNQDNLFDTIDNDESSYSSLSTEQDNSMDIYSPFDVDAEEWSNDDYKWSEFVGRIGRLPASAQDVLFDSNAAYSIKDIASNHELTEDQIKNLSRVVRDTILGDLVLGEMSSNIATKLNLSNDIASAIANSIISYSKSHLKTKRSQRNCHPDHLYSPTDLT